MQETRQHILEILHIKGQATVDELVGELRDRRGDTITAVTVRHHLNELLRGKLITTPELKHRNSPGRPQHIYTLTADARQFFPNNYQPLIESLLQQISQQFSSGEVNVILEGVADRMAANAQVPNVALPEKLRLAVEYLNKHGYDANWQQTDDGYELRTNNCPYHHIATASNSALCDMDMRLVASLIGVVPRLLSRASSGGSNCSYWIPLVPDC